MPTLERLAAMAPASAAVTSWSQLMRLATKDASRLLVGSRGASGGSGHVLRAIRRRSKFRGVFMKNDEHVQTVTVSRRLPKGIDPKLVLECTANPPDGEDVEVSLIVGDEIELTISLRGSLSYVQQRADWLIDNGIAWAQFLIEKPYR